MGNRRVWTGRWKGGRTFNGKDGCPVYVLRKMLQGWAYTVHQDARSETEAEAELALFLRDPEGYRTRPEARQLKQEAAVYLSAETVGRFFGVHAQRGHPALYVDFYLATWPATRTQWVLV